ncbi:hypothetical protein B1B05_13480 [Domibacillus enclensis]|uniref:Uncharacterized protein n=1 Tax=Domibacillus enclensis TaxID=1017273 RepID=A0ABX4E6Q7_9BACI|nr:hypothetical protein B1B05_13480 [Domibacillus enclensis]
MVKRIVTALALTQKGRLLQDFAFGGAGGELTFVATLQKWISPDPLDPSRVFVLRQPPLVGRTSSW